jgi:hypothetical protein
LEKLLVGRAEERSLMGGLKRIGILRWMADVTKARALAKLQAVHIEIGGQQPLRTYEKLAVAREDAYALLAHSLPRPLSALVPAIWVSWIRSVATGFRAIHRAQVFLRCGRRIYDRGFTGLGKNGARS